MRVGPVHKLATSPQEIPIQGIARNTNALGYVVINIQIGGIPSYNEEKVTLVIEDISGLGIRVPVILGMHTIHRLCCQMKESEIESAPDEWQNALCSYEASQGIFLQAMMPGTDNENGIKYPTNTGQNPMDLDEPMNRESYHPCFCVTDSKGPYEENLYARSLAECHGPATLPGG